MIGMEGKKESKDWVLLTLLDDDHNLRKYKPIFIQYVRRYT